MTDETILGELPTPAQMLAFNEVERATRTAVKLREASMAPAVGGIAVGFCVVGTALSVMHDSARYRGNSPFIGCAMVLGFIVWFVLSLRRMKLLRGASTVSVVDRREDDLRKAVVKPRKVALTLAFLMFINMISVVVWSIALRHMSNSAIVLSLALAPALGVGFFLYRLAKFGFWEDLLFAFAVGLAYSPLLLQQWRLSPLSFGAIGIAGFATWALHRQWLVWARSHEDKTFTKKPMESEL